MVTIDDLITENYNGCSIRSIVSNQKFRKKVIEDRSVRGNREAKQYALDKLSVAGKVLLTGPTGEAKTLFARVLLNHITDEINNRKYHIKGCPFFEDASYLVKIISKFNTNTLSSISVLQSLCPFCRANIEKALSTSRAKISLDNTEAVLKISKQAPNFLKKVEAEKTLVRLAQIDPRNDPESLYMLLAGAENLEQLLSSKTKTTFEMSTHKVGILSQGFLVVNEIQRLHLSLLESLMGFLEDPQGIKYNIAGQSVYVDGAIIFTSNAPLTVFGEESQPIINRIPEVLWPARNVLNRVKIVQDMFEEHLIVSKMNIPSNPEMIKMFELTGEGKRDFISRLAYEFVAYVASESIPPSVKTQTARSENKLARSDFYNGLDEIHNPQRSPHIDLRTLNNAIGEIVIRAYSEKLEEVTFIALEPVQKALSLYEIPQIFINNGLQAIKQKLRNYVRKEKPSITVEDITEELDKLSSITKKELKSIVFGFEGIENYDKTLSEKIFEVVSPSYERLLELEV